jgi:tetratricopeptide (TPR) repeat protein
MYTPDPDFTIGALLTNDTGENDMGIEIDYQLHRVSVDVAKAFRQLQKADKDLSKGNVDRASKHYDKGLKLFATAADHAAKADDDAYNKAGNEVGKGNKELQKSIDSLDNGDLDRAADHYADAMDSYDNALDLIS